MSNGKSDLQLARTWLAALETAARDTMGVAARGFLRTVYRRAAEEWLETQALENGWVIRKVSTARAAIEEYVASGAQGGLLRSKEDIEIKETPFGAEGAKEDGKTKALNLTVHRCPYKGVCQGLVDAGLGTHELTCPRLGCLSGAILILAGRGSTYQLEEFVPHGHCRGTISLEE